MRLPALLAIAALALLGGCGSSSDETTTSGPAAQGDVKQKVRAAWEQNPDCRPPKGASRWACSVGSYRCQGVVAGRGLSISCSKPGESVAFLIRRD